MDANAPCDDVETADIVDLSTEDGVDKGKKRMSTTEVQPSAVKKVKLSYKDSCRSSSPSRPQNTLWQLFDKSEMRQNKVHHTAYCKACTLANDRKSGTVTGKAESMKPHLIQCNHVTEEVRKWAREWTKDSPAFVGSDSSSSQQQSRQQSNLGKFMNLKDAPMTAEEQQQFDMLLLKGTVSANLPFTWIDNEYIQEAFKVARPEVQLPSRRQLAGMLLCFCHLHSCFCFPHSCSCLLHSCLAYSCLVTWAAGPFIQDLAIELVTEQYLANIVSV